MKHFPLIPFRRIRSIRPSIYTLLLMVLLLSVSCKKNPTHPGYAYIPDMDLSVAYETYTKNTVFDDSSTMRLAVKGTMPRGFMPYPFSKTDEDLAEAGRVMLNPLDASVGNIERGEVLYERFCSLCHGSEGTGQGILYTSGKFPLPPGDLTTEKVMDRSDGELYHIITVGYGIMAAYGDQVLPDERWKTIHYVRHILQDTTLQRLARQVAPQTQDETARQVAPQSQDTSALQTQDTSALQTQDTTARQ